MTDREQPVAAPITMVQLAEWEADHTAYLMGIARARDDDAESWPVDLEAAFERHAANIDDRYAAALAAVRRLSDRVRMLEDWGHGNTRRVKPFPPERACITEQDDDERERGPETERPAEEAPERADFAAPDGGFRARRV